MLIDGKRGRGVVLATTLLLSACASMNGVTPVGGDARITGPLSARAAIDPSAPVECTQQTCPIDIVFGTTRIIRPQTRMALAGTGAVLPINANLFSGDRARELQFGRVQVLPPSGYRTSASRQCDRQTAPVAVTPVDSFSVAPGVRIYTHDEFVRQALQMKGTIPGCGREALLFVHGYNVKFEDAAKRMAQLVSDTGYCGIPISFSWPSEGDLLGYEYDRESAEYSVKYLKEFIQIIRRELNLSGVRVIAHSMGNIVTLRALMELREQESLVSMVGQPLQATVKEVILAAPDVDSDVFRQFLGRIGKVATAITLYASSKDRALKVSRRIARVPRAGEIRAGNPVIVENVETIDISRADPSFWGLFHSTFAEKSPIVTDIRTILTDEIHRAPDSRNPSFIPRTANAPDGGRYWALAR